MFPSRGYTNELEATFLFQSCGSEVRLRLASREALKQGSKTITRERNLVTTGISPIDKSEVFNRRGFQPNPLNSSGTDVYTDKTVAGKDFHSYFHRPETETGRGMAGMVIIEPALAAGSRRNDIFPT